MRRSPSHPLRRVIPVTGPARNRAEDVRLFLMTFVAGFLAFTGLIY